MTEGQDPHTWQQLRQWSLWARASWPSSSSLSSSTHLGSSPGPPSTPDFSEASFSSAQLLSQARELATETPFWRKIRPPPREAASGAGLGVESAGSGRLDSYPHSIRGSNGHSRSSSVPCSSASSIGLLPSIGLVSSRAKMTSVASAGSEMQGAKLVVGFVGLGNMGGPMADNLIRAGFPLLAFDRDQSALDRVTSARASAVSSAAELAYHADVIVTMLPSPAVVRQVYIGEQGFFSSPSPIRTTLFIDSSTVDPDTAKAVAEASTHCQVEPGSKLGWGDHPRVVDAPVSGGVLGARAGTLSFMVGGEEGAFEAAQPLLYAMGKKVLLCGPSGSGSAAKLCNNLALAIQMASVSEALALGQRLGLDPKLLSSIFNSSSARCWSSDTYNPAPGVMESVPAASDYKGGFTCALMDKDLNLALEAAGSAGAVAKLGLEVQNMYKSALESGLSDRDFSVIYKHVYGGARSSA